MQFIWKTWPEENIDPIVIMVILWKHCSKSVLTDIWLVLALKETTVNLPMEMLNSVSGKNEDKF